jgi:hypothetical protein
MLIDIGKYEKVKKKKKKKKYMNSNTVLLCYVRVLGKQGL